MVTSFAFTEPKILRGAVVCRRFQLAGLSQGYQVPRPTGSRVPHRSQVLLPRQADRRQADARQARDRRRTIRGSGPQGRRGAGRQDCHSARPPSRAAERAIEPTLKQLYEHWMLYATAHKRPRSVLNDKQNFAKIANRWQTAD